MLFSLEREELVNTNLRLAREASGKTQAQVAKEIEVSEQMYQRYEYGRCEPSVRKAIRIAKAVGSTVEQLWSV